MRSEILIHVGSFSYSLINESINLFNIFVSVQRKENVLCIFFLFYFIIIFFKANENIINVIVNKITLNDGGK